MNKTVNMKLKTLLILIALVALAAWLSGCGSEKKPIVQVGTYEGQNAITVLEEEGMFVNTDDLKAVCRYVDKLGSDGRLDDDDLLALGERISSDIGKPMTMSNASDFGFVAGIGITTYCPEFYDLIGTH